MDGCSFSSKSVCSAKEQQYHKLPIQARGISSRKLHGNVQADEMHLLSPFKDYAIPEHIALALMLGGLRRETAPVTESPT